MTSGTPSSPRAAEPPASPDWAALDWARAHHAEIQMRYGDMVALLVKVHEEYRDRQENEKNEKERQDTEAADVSMGEKTYFRGVDWRI